MPRTRQPKPTGVTESLLEQFAGPGRAMTASEIDEAMRRFKKALIERALGGELTHHLGYPPGGAKPETATNHRNGTSAKTVLTDQGCVAVDVPRDREGTFAPVLLPKHERRFTGLTTRFSPCMHAA